jgi:probable addiction module antidote protein
MAAKSRKPEDIARRLSKALESGDAAFTSALMEIVKQVGITAVAKRTGVSRHTLYRYEWGSDRPMLETALKVTSACGFKLMVVPTEPAKTPPSSAQ